MIRLKTLHELKRMPPTHEIVHVKSVDKLFRCHEGEWIERAYYNTEEVAEILGVPHRRAQYLIHLMGFHIPMSRKSVKYDQLVFLVRAMRLKKEHPKMMYREIKKMLGL